ncbi:NPC intracellular sterol transporter 1-related protein 1 [Taenia solium]
MPLGFYIPIGTVTGFWVLVAVLGSLCVPKSPNKDWLIFFIAQWHPFYGPVVPTKTLRVIQTEWKEFSNSLDTNFSTVNLFSSECILFEKQYPQASILKLFFITLWQVGLLWFKMYKSLIFGIVFLMIIASTTASCVLQGVCGKTTRHVCFPGNVPTVTISSDVNAYCPQFSEGSEGCCTTEQIEMLKNGLKKVGFYFGRHSKCFQLMKTLFCNFHCRKDQNKVIYNIVPDSDNSAVSMTVEMKEQDSQELFDACKDIRFLGIRVANRVCIRKPCDAKEFIRSLGTSKANGGRAPMQINFKLI